MIEYIGLNLLVGYPFLNPGKTIHLQMYDIAQSLYEKKLISYPRTSSRYLTEGTQYLRDYQNGIYE